MKFNKGIIGIIIGFAVLAAGLAGLSVFSLQKSNKQFVSDGYILDASVKENTEAISDTCEQIYFSSGARYKEKFDKLISFKNSSNEKVELAPEQFIHYSDESMGSFTKGVIMDLNALKQDNYGYYSVTKNTVLLKNGQSYEMTSHGEKISMPEFIWKISDTDYTIVSPSVTISLGSNYEVVLEGYAQIKYVDNGIVKIVHQQGTYQTVSSDAYLKTADGAVLNLAGKNFYVEDKPVLSLDSIALNDSNYLNVDENIDAPTIPTFNVVNGADGQNGMDGEIGLEGEQGATGEDGYEGAQGAQGSQGAAGAAGTNGENGASGKAGTDGSDGVEGDIGEMGMDGKNGSDGKNAENSNDIKVDNNVQPEVTMDTKEYKVTAGSANVKLSMTDLDGSLVLPDGNDYPFTLKMYNKQTMEEIEIPNQENLQANLMNGTPITFNVAGLNADTEYLIQVVGSYEVEDGQIREVVFYNKSFRTEAVGLELFKKEVTDHDFILGVNKNNSDVETYTLNVYKEHESNGEPIIPDDNPMTYVWKKTDGNPSSEYLFRDATPIGTDVESNTQYYACISGVTDIGGAIKLDYSVTEIAFRTLKEKPYQEKEVDGVKNQYQISAIMPVLHPNDKTGSMELEAPELVDKDHGIIGYRYELHSINSLDGITEEPAYVLETKGRENVSFKLAVDDDNKYVGKVIVIFDDNEKTVEYSTAYSGHPEQLSGNAFPNLIWKFDMVKHEMIQGSVTIVDDGNICAITADNPGYLVIRNEYEDEISFPLLPSNVIESTANNKHTITYNFSVDSLRTKNLYNFSVLAPVNTNGDRDAQGNNIISDAEKTTYLGGTVEQTTDNVNQTLAIVGQKMSSSTDAFLAGISFTTSKSNAATKEEKEYQASVLHYVAFELYHVTGEGDNQKWDKLGRTYTYYDQEPYDTLHHDSVFYENFWIDGDYTSKTANRGLVVRDAYTEGTSHAIILNPESFDLQGNFETFYSGGWFVIRIAQDEDTGELAGIDYTKEKHDNKVYFENGESEFWFEIAKKHVQATNPNSEVDVRILTKNMVNPSGYPELDNSTAVGLQILGGYKYSDAKEITYSIYEIDPEQSSNVKFDTNLYPDWYVKEDGSKVNGYVNGPNPEDVSIYPGGINKVAKTEDDTQVAKLVAYATLTNLGAQSGNIERVRLYFDDARFVKTGSHGTLKGGGNNWTLVDPDYKFERGKQYFVTYSVLSDHNDIDCDDGGDGKGVDDIYPFCTFNTNELVPYYRSQVITVDRQVPQIERYLDNNVNNKPTWKMRIYDPDYAITDGDPNGDFIIDWKKGNFAATKLDLDFNDPNFTFTTNVCTNKLSIADYTKKDSKGNVLFGTYAMSTGFANANYYKSSFTYKINNVSDPVTKVSDPYLYVGTQSNIKKPSEITATSIYRTKNASTGAYNDDEASLYVLMVGEPLGIKDGETQMSYEPTIVDDGGYRYRLALRGGLNTLRRIAALRVTIEGSHPDHPDQKYTVVYDPVFIDIQKNSKVLKEYGELTGVAYAYLDTGALKEMVDAGVKDASVSVQAYYANGKRGMETVVTGSETTEVSVTTGYTAKNPVSEERNDEGVVVSYTDSVNSSMSFLPETNTNGTTKLYAIMKQEQDGSSSYASLFGGNLTNTTVNASERLAAVKSIFAAGSRSREAVGFNPYDSGRNGYFAGRYSSVPMCGNANEYKLDSFDKVVSFNDTGMVIGGSYYEIENLNMVDLTFYDSNHNETSDENKVNVSAILPAIKLTNAQDDKLRGAKTITPEFEALGTGANTNSKLYVRIYECVDKSDNKNIWEEVRYDRTVDESGKTIFRVADGDNRYNERNINDSSQFEGMHIAIKYDSVTGRYILPTSIRNLKPETDYRVKLFTYVQDGDQIIYKELYSDDKGIVGNEYPFITREKVKSMIGETPIYEYDSYKTGSTTGGTGKKVSFTFKVDGDDGTGINVYYQLFNADGTQPVGSEKLLPYVSETMQYYSQDPDDNHRITFSFDPAAEVRCGGTYTVKVTIRDRSENPEELGTATKTFTAPGLQKPTFTISRSISKNENGLYDVNVGVKTNNAMHSVMDDKYEVYIYPNGANREDDESYLRATVSLNRGQEPQDDAINNALTNLNSGDKYWYCIVANVDTNNDGVVDEQIVQDELIYITPMTSATLLTKASRNKVQIDFVGLNNFVDVDHIRYKITHTNNGVPIAEGTKPVSELIGYKEDKSHTSLGLILDGLNISGDIMINVQYYSVDNEYLGDDSTGTTVSNNLTMSFLQNTMTAMMAETPQDNEVAKEKASDSATTVQRMMPAAGAEKVMSSEDIMGQMNTEIGAANVIEKEVIVNSKAIESDLESQKVVIENTESEGTDNTAKEEQKSEEMQATEETEKSSETPKNDEAAIVKETTEESEVSSETSGQDNQNGLDTDNTEE